MACLSSLREMIPYYGLVPYEIAGFHCVESPINDEPPDIETSSDVNDEDAEDEFHMAEVSI